MKGFKLMVAALFVAACGSLFAPMADAHFRFPRAQARQNFRQGFRAGQQAQRANDFQQGFHR
jgi:hypothetical protein